MKQIKVELTNLSSKPKLVAIPDALANFDLLSDSGYIRLPVMIGLYGISAASIWRGIKNSTIPKPVKISFRCTGWNVGVIRADLAAKAAKQWGR